MYDGTIAIWVAITLTVHFLDIVEAQATNPCPDMYGSALKTWGSDCQKLCHCRNNTKCDGNGICLLGCEIGWLREITSGTCSIPDMKAWLHPTPEVSTLLNRTPMSKVGLLMKQTFVETTEFKGLRLRREWKNKLKLYRFVPPGNCLPTSRGTHKKYWTILLTPPVFVRKVLVFFEEKLLLVDGVFALVKLYNHSEFSETRQLHKLNDATAYSTIFSSFKVADSLRIVMQTSGGTRNCQNASLAAVLLYGQPICPYRKWGAKCEKDCPCPCHIAECHPITGHCWTRGYSCQSAKYGPSCLTDCSSSCRGRPLECHVIYATCKQCWNESYSGPSCQTLLTPVEQQLRFEWCKRFILPEMRYAGQGHGQSKVKKISETETQAITVGASVTVVLVLFLVGCCIYIQIVRYCARIRLVEQMNAFEAERRRKISMQSYSEFHKEFYEMHGRKKSSLTDSTKSLGSVMGSRVDTKPRVSIVLPTQTE